MSSGAGDSKGGARGPKQRRGSAPRASEAARRAALTEDQRAFRARNPAVLGDALPYALWKARGYGTNRKPAARRALPGGEEKWFRAKDVFKRRAAAGSSAHRVTCVRRAPARRNSDTPECKPARGEAARS